MRAPRLEKVSLSGGVDEAGRGSLLGPLVVAGVSVTPKGIRSLSEMGVKDSKLLTPRQRESLYPQILKVAAQASWECIPPSEIDEYVLRGRRLRKLNYLEAIYFAKVIDRLGAEKVTVDASDVIPRRFGKDVAQRLVSRCKVVAFHKADRDFPVVSAASIVAKVRRDGEVKALKESSGDFGSGYPSDPVTRAFFRDKMKRGEPLPPYARKSWKTWAGLEQSLIGAF